MDNTNASHRRRRKKNKTSRNKANSKRLISLWICGIASAVVALALIAAVYALRPYDSTAKWIYIPESASAVQLRDSLISTLGGDVGARVYNLWRIQGGDADIAHGAYLINRGDRSIMIARRLATGRQTPVTAEWSDARTLDAMAVRLTKTLECSPEDLLDALERILPDSSYTKPQFPAALLPAKFEFYWSASPDDIVRKLLQYRNNFWSAERREKAEKLNLTPIEVTTLASIVEEETAKPDERGRVARLYLNRLAIGMPLRADPTVKFAVGNPALQRILKEHLRTPSPYNTYLNHGLPPGPIRIVNERTIDAVLDAPQHDYLYMCAKSDFSGYHDFAVNYADHLANARRYQAELDRRGIK